MIVSFLVPVFRLLEESRINRMRLEAAKANSAAVVRQQVFYFDPNYRDQVGVLGADGVTMVMPNPNMGAGGLLPQLSSGEGYFDPNGSVADDNGSVSHPYQPYNNYAAAGPNVQMRGANASVGGTSMTAAVLAAPLGVGGSMKVNSRSNINNSGKPTQQQFLQPHRHGSTGHLSSNNLQAAAVAYNSGTSNHSQEELLRQLFPSWF